MVGISYFHSCRVTADPSLVSAHLLARSQRSGHIPRVRSSKSHRRRRGMSRRCLYAHRLRSEGIRSSLATLARLHDLPSMGGQPLRTCQRVIRPLLLAYNSLLSPKIHSVKDLLQKASFTVYDAVPSSASSLAGAAKPTDPEIEKFLPMLEDYLKSTQFSLHLIGIYVFISPYTAVNAIDTTIPTPKLDEPQTDDSDYVWDVFYSRPVDELELSKLSQNVGTV